jgi:hypothetical protein
VSFIDAADAICVWLVNERQVAPSSSISGYKYNGYERIFIEGESVRVPTFCPKMLGGIDNGQLPATIMDRSIRVRLHRLDLDALAELNIEERDIEELAESGVIEELQKELSQWANPDTVAKLKAIKPNRAGGAGMSARQWEISKPLIKIATLFGVEKAAVESITAVFAGEEVETEETRILKAARELFDGTNGDRITTAMLAEKMGYTPDRLSRTLAKLGVKARPMKFEGNTVRGYFRPEFVTAWERYLS